MSAFKVWDYEDFFHQSGAEISANTVTDAAEQFVESSSFHYNEDRFVVVLDESAGGYKIIDFVKQWTWQGVSRPMTLEQITEELNK